MKTVLADGRLTQRGWGRHPQTTYVPHAWQAWGMGVVRGCARAVPVQGSTSLAPLPLDSTPTQLEVGFLMLTKN